MGSLMAGWDSPVQDPKAVKYRRNRSLTKEEIEAYWRSKKKIEKDHLQESLEKGHSRSTSLPFLHQKESHVFIEDDGSDLKKFAGCWWTRSNWAFLNEPPVIESEEGAGYKYAPQHHVANLASSKPDTPISTV